jgi:hypothetical protein
MNIVTGVHRSGTSFITNLVAELGADLGDESKRMEGDEWNVKGYFENRDVTYFNDWLILGPYSRLAEEEAKANGECRVLVKLFAPFAKLRSGWGVYPKAIERRAERRAERIKEFDEELAGATVKDVRFSLTLAAWRKRAKIDKILYTFRYPEEVAKSIQKRYNAPLSVGFKTWRNYVEEFFRAAEGIPTAMVYYNNFFDEAHRRDEINRLYAFLETPPNDEEAERVVSTTLDKRLKHNQGGDRALPSEVARLHERLLELHKDYATLKPFAAK